MVTGELSEGVVLILVKPVESFLDPQPFGPTHKCRCSVINGIFVWSRADRYCCVRKDHRAAPTLPMDSEKETVNVPWGYTVQYH